MLQVPDQFAGQMMKCPLCAGTFTVPALPQTPAAAMAPARASAPPPPPSAPAPPPFSAPAAGGSPAPQPFTNNSPTPQPLAGYQHIYSVWIRPELTRWLAPGALVAVFVLLFLPWIGRFEGDKDLTYSGFQTAFGEHSSGLGTLYALLFLVSLVLAVGSSLLPSMGTIPPALQQFMPWRTAFVTLACLVALVFIALQVLVGFGPEMVGTSMTAFLPYHTIWLRLAVFCHVLALAGAALDFWLAMRGDQTPLPRIDVNW